MSNPIKSTTFKDILACWPIITTIAGLFITLFIQHNILSYRITEAEKQISSIRSDIKETFEEIGNNIKDLQLDVKRLVTLQEESQRRDNIGGKNGFPVSPKTTNK